ncbi:MAG: restriction endonuclease subunit S [Spirochaetota bacterium]
MSSELKPYARYKDSGVEWLGEVPEHWGVKRMRFVCSLNPSPSEVAHFDGETVVTFVPMEAVGEDGSLDTTQTQSKARVENGFTYFANGDVAFAKITPSFENGKGTRFESLRPFFGFGTTELTVLRPLSSVDSKYLLYLTFSAPFRNIGEFWMYGAGGQKRVPDEFVRNFTVGFPPLPEQRAIADHLDAETGRIDTLISEQRELIELLKEKRQALISHCVTRGLDPDVPMKDSGVEWLGEVPEHWNMIPAGRVFREAREPGDDSLPVLTVSIHDGVSDSEYRPDRHERKVARMEDRSKYLRVRPGDLVYNMMRAWQGGLGAVKVDGLVSPAYVVARPTRRIVTRFTEYLLRTPGGIEQLRVRSKGVTDFRLRLYWDEFRTIQVVLPPLPEQHAIADYLDAETARIDALITEAEQTITLMQEHRSALISACVTGKVRVPGVADPAEEEQTA